MKNQVDGHIKEDRSKILIELSDKNEKEFINKYIGKKVKVLIEQKVKDKEELYEGYTENYIKIEVSGCIEEDKGKIIKCNVNESLPNYGLGIKI